MSSQDNEGNESEHSDQLLSIVLPWAEVQKWVQWSGQEPAAAGSSLPQAGISFPGTQADIWLTTRGPELDIRQLLLSGRPGARRGQLKGSSTDGREEKGQRAFSGGVHNCKEAQVLPLIRLALPCPPGVSQPVLLRPRWWWCAQWDTSLGGEEQASKDRRVLGTLTPPWP